MRVEIMFPTGERIAWSFPEVPREGDVIEFVDAAPRAVVRVENVTWVVNDRGCQLAQVRVV